jgi:chemotaxis protein methyltransferase CheR
VSAALEAVAELVRRETGIVVKEVQHPSLAAAIERVAPGVSPQRLAAELSKRGGDGLLHSLVDEVTVQETYFFRELPGLRAIDWQELLRGAAESGFGLVRVWVAACATGEEAYSLAILAKEALGQAQTPVSILATDISNAALARASAGGGYSERSVRNLSPALRERYLRQDEGRYWVKEELRSLVRFRHHNLISDPCPPIGEVPFDVVACRNVLIYFDPEGIRRVLGSLSLALRPGGHLALGAADRLTGTADELSRATAPTERRRWTPRRALRRPLGLEPRENEPDPPAENVSHPSRRVGDRIEETLLAADRGDLDAALSMVEAHLAEDPTAAEAHFVRGLVELARDDPGAAASSLRRCLYLDPSFGLAAFELGRAYDASGDGVAARRAYEQALRTLDAEDERHRGLLDQVDLGDVAAACAARLAATGDTR